MRATNSKRPKRCGTTDRANLPPSPLEPLAVRPAQAARLLSVSERTIWTHIAKGQLKVSRIGNITLVHVASIRALLDATNAVSRRAVARRAAEALPSTTS
jgi:hypothetical protein